MTRIAPALALFLLACPAPPDPEPPPGPEPTPDPAACNPDDYAPLPVQFERLDGIVSAEDFALMPDGGLVSVDENGNFIRNAPGGGTPTVVSPNLADETAGIAALPDGKVVVADVSRGALILVDPATGGSSTILSGLSYPNGVEVHRDGWIAVAEQDAGQVRRVDPESGEFVVLGTGFTNPNGVTFSPDFQTLYVGSFGGGTVHSIPLSDEGAAGEPELFASMGEAKTPSLPEWAGDPWYEGCADAQAGDACTILETPGTCADLKWGLLCTADDDPFAQACDGLSQGEGCTIDGWDGSCMDLGKDAPVCWDEAWWGFATGGGLDGVAVDACGAVYVTVFDETGEGGLDGNILRATERGAEFEVVANLPAGWVPNMEFGNGVEGWDTRTLYVNTRDQDAIFALDIGVLGRPRR